VEGNAINSGEFDFELWGNIVEGKMKRGKLFGICGYWR
jgi:hypothetical protein